MQKVLYDELFKSSREFMSGSWLCDLSHIDNVMGALYETSLVMMHYDMCLQAVRATFPCI